MARKIGRSKGKKRTTVGVDREGAPMTQFKRRSAPPTSRDPRDEFRAWLRPRRASDQFPDAIDRARVSRTQYYHLQVVDTPKGYKLMTPAQAKKSGHHHWPFAPRLSRKQADKDADYEAWLNMFKEKKSPKKKRRN